MTKQDMIDLVERYFYGVDHADFDVISETLTDDCVFSIETHSVRLLGKKEIELMFHRLWNNHVAVCHQEFVYVPNSELGRIAARFSVINHHHDGSRTYKSNCNFFEVRDRRFSHIAVYMAGENTLSSE